MNKRKILVGFSLILSLVLSLSIFASEKIDTRAGNTSTCILRNPPDADVSWKFGGNQIIWVTVENGNVLGVTATLTCEIFTTPDVKSWVLLPFGKTSEERYSMFGNAPIGWRFTLATISDAALLTANARWDNY